MPTTIVNVDQHITPEFIQQLNDNFTALANSDASALVVADLTALKALTSRFDIVLVKTGRAAGMWQWHLASTTTADDSLVVTPTAGTSGRYKRIYNAPDVYASWFGAVGDGTTDDTAALQAAINAVNEVGGGNVYCGNGRWLIDSADLDLKEGVYLVGSWRTYGRPGANSGDFSTTDSAFILNSTYTISIQEYGCGIQGMCIFRKGLTIPASIRTAVDAVTAFAGTAITVGNGASDVAADCSLSQLFIVGFAQAINSDWSSRGRFTQIQGDNTAGIVIANSYDVQQLSNVHFWPFLTSGYTPTTYAVSGAVSNGGLVRLTVASNAILQTGDRVTVASVGGVTGASGPFTITVINSTTIDLQGSTFGGTYTSGGTVYLSAWYRSGIGIHLNSDTDWGQATNCFAYNYATGIKVSASDNGTLVNCGADTYFDVLDTSLRGIWISSDCSRMSLESCKTAGCGVNLDIDVNASEGDVVLVTNHRTWGAVTYPLRVTDGAAKFINCGFQTPAGGTSGAVRIESAAEEPVFIGGDMEGVTFSYASASAPRPSFVGVRGQGAPLQAVVNATSGASQAFVLEAHSSSPTANDGTYTSYKVTNSSNAQVEVARETFRATVVAAGSEAGQVFWSIANGAGSLANALIMSHNAIQPAADGSMYCGIPGGGWFMVALYSTGTINFGNSDYTVTHSTGSLAFSGTIKVAGVATMSAINYAADAQANDTYVITLSPAPTAYTTGMQVIFKANTANTGAATLNVNSLGAKTIVKAVSTTLANNDILANMFCLCVYDGTNFVLMNPRVL